MKLSEVLVNEGSVKRLRDYPGIVPRLLDVNSLKKQRRQELHTVTNTTLLTIHHHHQRTSVAQLLTPLLRLNSLRRPRLNRALRNISPIGAEGGSVTLGKALHHGALLLGGGVRVELFEPEIRVLVSLLGILVFVVLEDGVPVLGASFG